MQLRNLLRLPRFVPAHCFDTLCKLSLSTVLLASTLLSPSADTLANPFSENSSLRTKTCSMQHFFSDVRQFFGIRYRFGGQTPEGFDCSGFVRYMFNRIFQVKLPRTSAEMASIGRKVERSELMPGDLVFFQTRGNRINHVGIFVGNDTFVHSSVSRGITEDKLEAKYFDRRFACAVRVLDNSTSSFPEFSLQPTEISQNQKPS